MIETNYKDRNGTPIKVGDKLHNPFSGYTYEVKFGTFTLDYTKPFPIHCLGFYVEYKEDNHTLVDSFAMLTFGNLEIVK